LSCYERPCRIEHNQKVSAFIKKYEDPDTQKQFGRLVAITRLNCEKLLEFMSIKGVVQGRIKKSDSLKRKLKLYGNGDDDSDDSNNIDEEADAIQADTAPEKAAPTIYDENGDMPDIKQWISEGKNMYETPERRAYASHLIWR
jgi:hypothetical protein